MGSERNRSQPSGFDSPAEARLHGFDEDARRMLAYRDGDASAFEALFGRWSGPLLHYLQRMVRDAAAAEELVQEAFLRVHRARQRYRPDARFSTWLYRIATNLALNELRRSGRREPHQSLDAEGTPELAAAAPAVDAIAHARRVGGDLELAFAALPERQRAALWLSAVEGLSYADVARALDVSEPAVKSLVHRARSKLAERFEYARPDSEEAM